MNCCAHHNLPAGCNQGRACPKHSGFPPLHRAFPIEREDDDAPLYTAESAAEPLPRLAKGIAGFLAFILLAVSAVFLSAIKGTL